MGIFSDLLANATSIDTVAPVTALDKVAIREVNRMVDDGDVDYPTAVAARNEVQTIEKFATDPTGGDFTLTFTLRNGETFTTAAIAYNASGATIEGAIDTAATAASITGWTNGDITVTGGTLLAAGATVVLTYDGASVISNNHVQATINGAGLTGGSLASPAQTTTTEGQTNRTSWAALEVFGVVAAANVPVQGVNPVAFTAPTNPGDNKKYPSQETIRALADEAAVEDLNIAVRTEILAAARLV